MGNMREEAERLIRQAQRQKDIEAQQQGLQKQQAIMSAKEDVIRRRRLEIEEWKRVSTQINQAVIGSNAQNYVKEFQRDFWRGKGKITTELASMKPHTLEVKEYPPEMWLNVNPDHYFDALVGNDTLWRPRYVSACVSLHFDFDYYREEVGGGPGYGYREYHHMEAILNISFSVSTIEIGYSTSSTEPDDSYRRHYNLSGQVSSWPPRYKYSCEPIAYNLANMEMVRKTIPIQLAHLYADAFQHQAATPEQLKARRY
jgi:hypothetical protein